MIRIGLTMIFTLMISCKTTDPISKISKDRSTITVFSSAERGSALSHASDSKKLTEAAKIIDKKLTKDPKNVSLLLDRARIYLIRKDMVGARTMCNRALREDLHNKKAAKLLGEIELGDNNLAKSEIILYRLGGRESKDPEILNLLGLIALRRDQVNEAFELFQVGLKTDEDNSALRMNIGIIHLQYRQIEQASREFELVLKSTPAHVDAKLHLAIAKAYKGENKTAESLYRQVLESDSNNHFALYNFALLHSKTKEIDSALKLVQQALKSKDFSSIQRKLAEELRDELIVQIKQRELEERKRRDEENKKNSQERKTSNASHISRHTSPNPV